MSKQARNHIRIFLEPGDAFHPLGEHPIEVRIHIRDVRLFAQLFGHSPAGLPVHDAQLNWAGRDFLLHKIPAERAADEIGVWAAYPVDELEAARIETFRKTVIDGDS